MPAPIKRLQVCTLTFLAILWPLQSFGQQVIQIRWPTTHAAAAVSFEGIHDELLPTFRMAVATMPEESIISACLMQPSLLGITSNEAGRLNGLFTTYYKRVRQSNLFRDTPSALPYCYSERRPTEGLATVYVPSRVSADSKTIVFLHGYGGSFLAYLHYMASIFPNHLIICPAYGISPAGISSAYILEAEKAVAAKIHLSTGKPVLVGLSAGGFGACRLYAQKPDAFRKLICIAAYAPEDAARQFNRSMEVRFICGAREEFAVNGSFQRQMIALKSRVRVLDWRIVEGADHFFLLSHEEQTKKTLREWETP